MRTNSNTIIIQGRDYTKKEINALSAIADLVSRRASAGSTRFRILDALTLNRR
jgi:hypothetical protein